MAILSGFRSFERYLKVPTEDGNKYQLISERTLAKDVIFDSDENKSLETKMQEVNHQLNGLTLYPCTEADYEAMESHDANTLYIFIEQGG